MRFIIDGMKSISFIVGGNWIDERVLNAMNEVAKTFVPKPTKKLLGCAR